MYAFRPKPKSMMPKTKIMKSGTMIANSTRLCAPCLLCSQRSIGYVLPGPDTGGTPPPEVGARSLRVATGGEIEPPATATRPPSLHMEYRTAAPVLQAATRDGWLLLTALRRHRYTSAQYRRRSAVVGSRQGAKRAGDGGRPAARASRTQRGAAGVNNEASPGRSRPLSRSERARRTGGSRRVAPRAMTRPFIGRVFCYAAMPLTK